MSKEKQRFFYISYIFHIKFADFIFFHYLCAANFRLIINHESFIQYPYRISAKRSAIDT